MATGSNEAELSGIQFFGKMSASISHEIKNVLAVINENAGLLEDICFMADRGKPIDTPRLKKNSGRCQGPGAACGPDRDGHEPIRPQPRRTLHDNGSLRVDRASRVAGHAVCCDTRCRDPDACTFRSCARHHISILVAEHALDMSRLRHDRRWPRQDDRDGCRKNNRGRIIKVPQA